MVATVKILPRARIASVTQSVPFGGKDHSSCSEPARDLQGAGRDGRTDGVSSAKDFD